MIKMKVYSRPEDGTAAEWTGPGAAGRQRTGRETDRGAAEKGGAADGTSVMTAAQYRYDSGKSYEKSYGRM